MASGDAVLLALSVAVVGGLGVVIVPRAIEGAESGSVEAVVPVDEPAREVYARVRALFESCEGVVGLWDRGIGGGLEIGLWYSDAGDPGVVNADEVVLLSFSPVLGVLAAYVEGEGGPALEGVEVVGGAGEAARGVALRAEDLGRGDFGAWWRGRAGVERRVIAAGLSDVRIARRARSGGEETLRVELVWGRETSDVGVEKGVFEVAVRRFDAAR